jgi:hypothetical protein
MSPEERLLYNKLTSQPQQSSMSEFEKRTLELSSKAFTTQVLMLGLSILALILANNK